MKKKKVILFSLIILFATTLTISLVNIFVWNDDNKKIEEETKTITDMAKIKEKQDSEKTEIIEQEKEVPKENAYWDYIKMNMIDVDFSGLKEKNKDTVGWIKVNGTNINYPVVQTSDNDYYLTHAFNKSKNNAGWVFMDYRNNAKNFNRNTIIYGHSRIDTTMFGSLKNIINNDWHKNSENYIVKMSSETENTLWQVFSVYHIPTTSDYLQIDFDNDDEYNTFLKMLIERSAFDFGTTVNPKDKILTLSTCYKKTDKVVLHAKLIKREAK